MTDHDNCPPAPCTIFAKNTYSPYGEEFAAEESDWQPYKIGGKESLTRVGLDLYDFGARMYSPSNMRWMTMDPLAEKYCHISPYAYCAGNPVNLVDPDGKMLVIWYQETDSNGKVIWKMCTYSGTEENNTKSEYVPAVIHSYKFNNENWEKAGYEQKYGKNPLVDLVDRKEISG